MQIVELVKPHLFLEGKTPEEGYHFMADMTDKAIAWIGQQKAQTWAQLDAKKTSGGIWGAVWSPDGSRVLVVTLDNFVRVWKIWPLLTVDTVAYAQVSTMRFLTDNERASLFLTNPQQLPAEQAAALGDDGPGKLCDRLAADPFDPKRASAPVPFAALESDKAIPACQAAVKDRPNEPRYNHELARALLRGGRGSASADAIEAMRSAAQRGYAAAIGNLGRAYQRGEGVKQDLSSAARLYQQASGKGFLPAFTDLASMYWAGIGVMVDREKALDLLRSGVEAGDPFSNLRLAELYEQGDGVPKDLQKTLIHYARALEIFGQLGDDDNRAIPRARLGSLARAISPATAVRLAREAMH